MKKFFKIISCIIFSLALTGCDFFRVNTTEVTKTEERIDIYSIVQRIYSEVYDEVEAELKETLYDEILAEIEERGYSVDSFADSIKNVASIAKETNVMVYTYKNGEASGTGSGVVYKEIEDENVNTHTYALVTNYHVIEGGDTFKICYSDEVMFTATLIGGDETTDLAFLTFECNNTHPLAEFGVSRDVSAGDIVLACGNPKGSSLFSTITMGVVGGNDRNVIDDGVVSTINKYIQHDAAINPGNSGGALWTLNKKVVGINCLKYVSTSTSSIEGLNFAIPIDLVSEVEYEIFNSETHTYSGTVSFGITTCPIESVSIEDLKTLNLFNYNTSSRLYDKGVVVIGVTAGSSSYGVLQVGDVIIYSGTTEITKNSQVAALRENKHIGDSVNLTIMRNGVEMNVTVTFKRTVTE